MRKPVLVYVWHVVFPDYVQRMAAMSQAVYLSVSLASSLTLVEKE